MRQLIIYFLVFGLTFISCELSGRITSFATNKTSHNIALYFYADGHEDASHDWVLDANTETMLARYLADGGLCYGQYLSFGMDSLVVVIGDRQAIHYSYNNPGNNPKALPIDHARNFFNRDNWQLHVLKDRRNRYDADYTYTFTEQDYLDAN